MELTDWLTLLIPLTPFVLPRAITFVKSLRAPSRAGGQSNIRPAPRRAQYALNILFLAAVVHLLRTLPAFAPENVFKATSSTFRTPNDVLFRRLGLLRPLTPTDEALKAKLASGEGRLLYALYGPDALLNCVFCSAKEPWTYFSYVAPAMMIPHLFHIGLLGVLTSSLVSGREGARFRMWATIAGVALAVIDLALMYHHGVEDILRSARAGDAGFFHWQRLLYRDLAMALVDGLLGFALWLAATNRMFVKPPTAAERLDHTYKGFEMIQAKLLMLTDTTNAVLRDKGLRAQYEAYWRDQEAEMDEILQEKEVVDAVNRAAKTIHLPKLTEMAKVRADATLSMFKRDM